VQPVHRAKTPSLQRCASFASVTVTPRGCTAITSGSLALRFLFADIVSRPEGADGPP
jgi:hypothetical protein